MGGGYGMGSGFGMGGGYGMGGYGATGMAAASAGFPTGTLGASNAGSVWNVSMRHQTRNTSWMASYYTTTTTIQQYLSDLATVDINQDGVINFLDRSISSPNLTDSVIVMKRAQVSFSWHLRKHNFHLSAYQGNYSYSTSNGRSQDMLGVNGNWTWIFNSRTSAMVSGFWQTSEYLGNALISNTGTKTDYYSINLTFTRHITENITGSLMYNHYHNNTSNGTVGNAQPNLGSYDTNRVTANVIIRF